MYWGKVYSKQDLVSRLCVCGPCVSNRDGPWSASSVRGSSAWWLLAPDTCLLSDLSLNACTCLYAAAQTGRDWPAFHLSLPQLVTSCPNFPASLSSLPQLIRCWPSFPAFVFPLLRLVTLWPECPTFLLSLPQSAISLPSFPAFLSSLPQYGVSWPPHLHSVAILACLPFVSTIAGYT